MTPQEMVRQFHEAFGVPVRTAPIANPPESELRIRLLAEETSEYSEAVLNNDPVGVAQELADIVYVAYGAALTHGIDLDAVIAEVHRANMSKLDANGQPIKRADGKILKSDLFRPADVASVLSRIPVHSSPLDAPGGSGTGSGVPTDLDGLEGAQGEYPALPYCGKHMWANGLCAACNEPEPAA